MLEASN